MSKRFVTTASESYKPQPLDRSLQASPADSSRTRTRSRIVFGMEPSQMSRPSVEAPVLADEDRAQPVYSNATRTQSSLFIGNAKPVLRSTAEDSYVPVPSDVRRSDLVSPPSCSSATRTRSDVQFSDPGGKDPALRKTSVTAEAYTPPPGFTPRRQAPSDTARQVHLAFGYGPGGGPEQFQSTMHAAEQKTVAAVQEALQRQRTVAPRGGMSPAGSPKSPGSSGSGGSSASDATFSPRVSAADISAMRLKSHFPFQPGCAADSLSPKERYTSVAKTEFVPKVAEPVVKVFSSATRTASQVWMGKDPEYA